MSPPNFYSKAAYLLVRMGHEEAGDQIILSRAELFKKQGSEQGYLGMHEVFIAHAFNCQKPDKAVRSAEIILKAKPDHVPALAVRMVKLQSAGDVEGAKRIAQRILELEKDPKSAWRKLAEEHK